PPRVYRGKAAFEFRTKDNKGIRLCGLNEPQSAVWLAYEKAVGEVTERKTLQALTEQFMASPDWQDLAAETRKDYTKYAGKVLP
ncbi:integrase, partial [Klebsiella pneumoniae]|nr:integrase [Klebsiella pneumoniae]